MLLQAAVEEGIVPGGGVALLYASKTLEGVKSKNASFDQKIGVDIVMKALQMPLKTIANNAGAPTLLAFAHHVACNERGTRRIRLRLHFTEGCHVGWGALPCVPLQMSEAAFSAIRAPPGLGALQRHITWPVALHG